jgi:hypothetical protein
MEVAMAMAHGPWPLPSGSGLWHHSMVSPRTAHWTKHEPLFAPTLRRQFKSNMREWSSFGAQNLGTNSPQNCGLEFLISWSQVSDFAPSLSRLPRATCLVMAMVVAMAYGHSCGHSHDSWADAETRPRSVLAPGKWARFCATAGDPQQLGFTPCRAKLRPFSGQQKKLNFKV